MNDAFDTVLGPSDQRYFGAGYRQSAAHLEAVSVDFPDSATTVVYGTARLHQWERVGAPRIAHLGTVDAISLAGTVSSLALIVSGLSPVGAEAELVSIAVRAGAVPVSVAGGVPVEARLVDTGRAADGAHAVECAVGSLSVRVTMRGRSSERSARLAAGDLDVAALLGPAAGRYFAEGIRRLSLSATWLKLGSDGGWTAFDVEPEGVELGVVECLVLTSQLAQAMLYDAAGVPRERTGNLWMRRCVFTSVPDDVQVRVAQLTVTKFTRFQRGGVDQVSAAVEVTAFPGWRGTASLAFQVLD